MSSLTVSGSVLALLSAFHLCSNSSLSFAEKRSFRDFPAIIRGANYSDDLKHHMETSLPGGITALSRASRRKVSCEFIRKEVIW